MARALVTGATAGIGAAFARRLAISGHDLVLVARDEPRLAQFGEHLARLYAVRTEVLAADLADPAACARVEERLAGIGDAHAVDVLVNNAGFGLGRSFVDGSVEDEQRMLDVMVRAVMRLTHAAVGPMRDRRNGAIVTVSSAAAFVPGGTYSAAKAWQYTFTESLAGQLRGSGVRVLGVYPGWTRTEFHARASIDMSSLPDFAWLDADEVARRALADLAAGRTSSVAGVPYRALTGLSRAMPRGSHGGWPRTALAGRRSSRDLFTPIARHGVRSAGRMRDIVMTGAGRRRRAAVVASALALPVALLLAGCNGGGGKSSDAAAATPQPTVNCTTASATPAVAKQETVTSGGEARTYNVWTPQGYDGRKPVPLIVDFHGTGGESVSYESAFSPMGAEAPKRGYLLVAPQATKGDSTALRWRVPGTGEAPNDVLFVSEMLVSIEKNYCVDPQRFYAMGFSSGGAFTTYLSCQLNVWAAVAPMSGPSLVHPCQSRPPVPMITFHGTNDLFVPYKGLPGAQMTTDPDGYYEADVQNAVDQWAVRNGCSTTHNDTVVPPVGKTRGPGSMITKRLYTGCKPGDDVVLYIVDGTGHSYPGGPTLSAEGSDTVGGQSQSIDSGKYILDFFDAHRRTALPDYMPSPEVVDTSVPTLTAGP